EILLIIVNIEAAAEIVVEAGFDAPPSGCRHVEIIMFAALGGQGIERIVVLWPGEVAAQECAGRKPPMGDNAEGHEAAFVLVLLRLVIYAVFLLEGVALDVAAPQRAGAEEGEPGGGEGENGGDQYADRALRIAADHQRRQLQDDIA